MPEGETHDSRHKVVLFRLLGFVVRVHLRQNNKETSLRAPSFA